jgi:hypothetical protein
VASPLLVEASRDVEASLPPMEMEVRPTRRPRSVPAAPVAFAVYAAIALLANLPTWPGDPSRIRTGDLDQMVWYLGWTPHAILHWQNLFATNWLNYPEGVNLAQNTSAPLLGLLTAPLTLMVSPVASLNLLLWLAFPLSALSMFFIIKRWTQWTVAAFVAGALYGFSPYVVAQSADHLNLAFVPLPPLIIMAAYETIRPGTERSLRWGFALGALLVAQFYISSEIAATSMLIIALSGMVLAMANAREVVPTIRRCARGLSLAVGVAVVGLAYPTWMMTEGAFRFRGPAYPRGVSADLLGTIAPTRLQRIVPAGLSHTGTHLLFGNITENGSYLGLPLILLLLVLLVICWRNRWVRFTAVMVVVTTVLSLGPRLIVDNHKTSIPLPWSALRHLPFADNIIVVRLSLYTALFASLLIALAMAELRTRWFRMPRAAAGSDRRTTRVVVAPALGLLGLASLLSLVPAWPLPTTPTSVPSFFTSPAVDRVPYGSVALISPYPSVLDVQAQMWQAVARFRFRIIGGYALVAGNRDRSSTIPAVLRPTEVERYLWSKATGGPPYPSGPVPRDGSALVCDLRSFLLRYNVDTVIATKAGAHPAQIEALYQQAIGTAPYVSGGVAAWFRVARHVEPLIRTCAAPGPIRS